MFKVFKCVRQNGVPYVFKMDLDDYLKLHKKSFSCINGKSGMKYLRVGTKLFHREVLKASKGSIVDHKDRNTFNNTKENLRICSYSQNSANRSKNGSTRGVSFNKINNNWRARVQFNKNIYEVGSYKNMEDAIEAYNKAAATVHGEFASLIKK